MAFPMHLSFSGYITAPSVTLLNVLQFVLLSYNFGVLPPKHCGMYVAFSLLTKRNGLSKYVLPELKTRSMGNYFVKWLAFVLVLSMGLMLIGMQLLLSPFKDGPFRRRRI